jgi:hypothetical protein
MINRKMNRRAPARPKNRKNAAAWAPETPKNEIRPRKNCKNAIFFAKSLAIRSLR